MHRTLSLAIAGTIAVVLFISLIVWLHPKRADTQPKIPEKDPKAGGTPDTAAPGLEGSKTGDPTSEANGKKPEDAPKDPNEAEHEKEPELHGGASGKAEKKEDEGKKAEGSAKKEQNPSRRSLDTEKSLLDDSSSSEDADDTSEGDEKKTRRASDPDKPSSASSQTHPLKRLPRPSSAATDAGRRAPNPVEKTGGSSHSLGGKPDDLDEMIEEMRVEELRGTIHLPPPDAKNLLDTLDRGAASGPPPASGRDDKLRADLKPAKEVTIEEEGVSPLAPPTSFTAPKSSVPPPGSVAKEPEKKEKKD